MEQGKRSLVSSLMEAAAGSLLFRSSSFKEDSYALSTLKPSDKKALGDLKNLLSTSTKPISIWGVPIVSSSSATTGEVSVVNSNERVDVVLLKFLRARDFNAGESHAMLLRAAEWRVAFGADGLSEEDLGFKDLRGVVSYMHGWDRDSRPVCYNAYGIFKDRHVYDRVFGDDEKFKAFLRWRVGVMEEGVRLLHLRPGGANSIVHVTDLKGMLMRELRVVSKHVLPLFQDNYPELVARKVFINVPWYYSVLYTIVSPFLTERTKSKFVVAGEGSVAETLYKYIRPEFIPVQYGGLSRSDGCPPRPASEFAIKGGEKVNLEIDGIQSGATITWEVAVGGWEVEYAVEFVPGAEGAYTLAVDKPRRIPASSEEASGGVFTAKEDGKLVISVDNTCSRRRKVAAYRYFVRNASAF